MDDSYAKYNETSNKKDPKFKVGDHVTISTHKNIFAKGYAQNWSEEAFVVSKIKNMVKKLLEFLTKKNCKRLIKKNLEQKKYFKEQITNCTSNGKGMIMILMVGLIKKFSYKNESILS